MLDFGYVTEVRRVAVDGAVRLVRLLVDLADSGCEVKAQVLKGLSLRPYAREQFDDTDLAHQSTSMVFFIFFISHTTASSKKCISLATHPSSMTMRQGLPWISDHFSTSATSIKL